MDSLFAFFFKYRPFLYQKGTITFESPLPSWLLWLASLGLVAIAWTLYQRRLPGSVSPRPPLSKGFALTALRSLLFVLLVVVLSRPVLHVSTVFPKENIAVVLIDDSKSMAMQDVGLQTRMDAVKQALDPAHGSFLADLDRRFQTRLFRFSRDIRQLNSVGELRPEGTGTNLETSLQSVLKEFGSAPLASVVVFTDGADNLSKDLKTVLGQYQSRKTAVNVVALGQTNLEKDVELAQVASPQKTLPDS